MCLDPPEYKNDFIQNWFFVEIPQLLRVCKIRVFSRDDLPKVPLTDFFLSDLLKTKSLTLSLCKLYLIPVVKTLPYFIVLALLNYSTPAIQRRILKNLEDNQSIVLLSFVLLLCPLLSALFRAHHMHLLTLIRLKMKKECIEVLYSKMLKSMNVESSTLVNLVSIDLEKITMIFTAVHAFVDTPLSLIVCTSMLYYLLGNAIFYGLFALFLCFILILCLSKIQRKLRTQLMMLRDERGKVIAEMLSNIRGIKLEGLVDLAQQRVEMCRAREQKLILKLSVADGCLFSVTSVLPVVISVVTFYFSLRNGKEVTPSTAFPTLTLFQMLQRPLGFLPMLIVQWTEAKVGIERMQKFLAKEEIKEKDVYEDEMYPICIKGNFSYEAIDDRANESEATAKDETPIVTTNSKNIVLRDINMKVKKGELVVVIGKVGSGKSTLISSMLGETFRSSKSFVGTCGKVGVVSSTPWLRNSSVLENILFGEEYNEKKLENVIYKCQLLPDIQMFKDGLSTEIGERGVTLSGGQKQRIALARIIYRNCDIVLLDDVSSAVDPHVAVKLFDDIILNELKNKTRVLCTHQLQFLQHADKIVVLENKRIGFMGTYAEYLQTAFATQMADMIKKSGLQKNSLVNNKRIRNNNKPEKKEAPQKNVNLAQMTPGLQELVKEENADNSLIKTKVFMRYIRQLGGIPVAFLYLIIAVLRKGLSTIGDYTLTLTPIPLIMYITFHALSSLSVVCKCTVEGFFGSRASTRLHNNMFSKITHSKFLFFDSTPLGRILNRFSKDIETIDGPLKRVISQVLFQTTSVLAVLVLNVSSSILFLPFLILLSLFYFELMRFYLSSSQNLERLGATTKSPIFSVITESGAGLSTIRAIHGTTLLQHELTDKIDFHVSTVFTSQLVERWLCLCVDVIGAFVIFGSVAAASFSSAKVAGLAISYALNATHSLVFLIKQFSELQGAFVSVERVLEYCDLPTEDEEDLKIQIDDVEEQGDNLTDIQTIKTAPPDAIEIELENEGTPKVETCERPKGVTNEVSDIKTSIREKCSQQENNTLSSQNTLRSFGPRTKIELQQLINKKEIPTGEIVFKNVVMRYREELPPILKDISFEIHKGEKIGICGRTGSGKSSLFQVLFRAVNYEKGCVTLDDIPLTDFPHDLLREIVGIIPQDPLVFKGTLKENVDPFNKFTEESIKAVVSKLEFEKTFSDLNGNVEMSGNNLSSGMKQMLCVIRECLRESKIVCLDEATAGVDYETDQKIQKSIRILMRNKTVITIAHRIHTIIDYDRIMVMNDGKIVEFDSPEKLLNNKDSLFAQMAKQQMDE
ncbi:metal resistance protein YCF1, putative [Entamoeba invadens IP1]|uniref:Metal resistance protein YCF1, putative n=1 Tax=Entamoeba invadens IP1 TaxID=370355 RepID=A0A0A1TZ46_ENTIV|nr:metal resistance protein YCF1, putative [Entamoeba invadens IP1]ELP86850.1 metal resistance protein YCF1, putative [Entamoeba invadens IP1]|eukprot:XP_004253621.1 metal resistance protein YCF1, putative [Entamoeba invadens IP1]